MIGAALALSLAASAPGIDSGATLRRFALLVGANDGGGGRALLHFADSDAQAMDAVLRQLGGVAEPDHLLVLDPDRAAFESAVEKMQALLEQSRAPGLRTELVVYYSGHSDETGLLLKGEVVSYRELRLLLDGIAADVRIAILDSCASGELTRLKGGVRRPAFLSDAANNAKGHAFLTSSSADEVAQESNRLGSSFFTHALISGLRGGADITGDGRVTLTEAYQFAFQETLARTERTRGGAQHPAYEIDLAGSGDVVMTDLRGTSAALNLVKPLAGRLFIRNSAGRLVVELAKPAGRAIDLALEPGAYQVTLDRDGQLFEAALTLVEGRAVILGEGDLKAVVGEATVRRGDEPAPAPAEAAAVAPAPTAAPPEVVATSPTYRRVPFNLSLWPGYDMNGDGRVRDQLALGVIVGADRLDGIGVALAGNWIRDEARGLEIANAFNYAGVLHGGQLSYGVNVASGGDSYGAQIATFVNVAGGPFNGMQWAGLVNSAGELHGAQLGIINVAGNLTGTQLGVINIADRVQGAQLGVVNVASDSDASVGLLNLGGHFHLDTWAGDNAPFNAGLHFGSRSVYTIVAFGYDPFQSEVQYTDYLGFGLHIPIVGKLWLDTDLGGGSTFTSTNFTPPQLLAKWRFTLGFSFWSHFSIFAGVALNCEIQLPNDTLPDIGYGLEASTGSTLTHLHFWPGPYLGLQI